MWFDFERKGLYPIGGGFAGDWVAGNEVVGRVLEPCLRIATMILDSSHLIPWVCVPLVFQWNLLIQGSFMRYC